MLSNPAIEAIMTRRSFRTFTDEPVEVEKLETIVECGRTAPSARNRQEWCFVVVNDREKIKPLIGAIDELGQFPNYTMYDPSAIIILGHKRDANFGCQDDGCAMENMMLAAHSLGVGSVWINQLYGNTDEPGIRPILKDYGLPDDYIVNAVLALGYPAGPPRDKEISSMVVWA